MNKAPLLFALCAWIACCSSTTLLPITDPNWYFTEFNWFKSEEGYAQSNCPGAYFKIGFTGTSAVLHLNQTNAATSPYATIKYVIDNGPAKTFGLPVSGDTVQLASGLQNTNHSLGVYIQNSDQGTDRWNVPNDVFRVTGLEIDSGSSSVAVSLRSKRMLVFWDSIGEGVLVLGPNGNDLNSNEATQTWAFSLAAALDAEVSMSAFGRLGYTIPGNGNVVPLYTPNDDSQSSWDKIDALHPRNFNGQLDFIFCGHGTNDGLNGHPADAVTASALGWLISQRSVVTSATHIFLTIPFGGFMEAALIEAHQTYQTKYNDTHTYLLNLGSAGQTGLTGFVSGGSWEASDGIHPLVWRDGQLGALLAVNAISLISQAAVRV